MFSVTGFLSTTFSSLYFDKISVDVCEKKQWEHTFIRTALNYIKFSRQVHASASLLCNNYELSQEERLLWRSSCRERGKQT